MGMKTRINRNFITQTNHDNASLTSMTTLVHRFPESGDYRGVVHFKGSPVSAFRIGVADPASGGGRGRRDADQGRGEPRGASPREGDRVRGVPLPAGDGRLCRLPCPGGNGRRVRGRDPQVDRYRGGPQGLRQPRAERRRHPRVGHGTAGRVRHRVHDGRVARRRKRS